MRTNRTVRSVAVLVAALAMSMTVAVAPASAGHGDWHQSGCRSNVWYHDVDVTDSSTGATYYDAWWWWIDWGIWGHDEYYTFGPIQGTYASWSWECGRLGEPWSPIYRDGEDWDGNPVWTQGFRNGMIRWHGTHPCWCYTWTGWAEVIFY